MVVEKEIKKLSPDRVICLGDIVGYAARPCECIDLVKSNSWETIAGNHDWASGGKIDTTSFNPYAQEAILWTRKIIQPEHQTFLANFPLSLKDSNFICAHSGLSEQDKFHYLDNYQSIYEEFSLLRKADSHILFVAHTHISAAFIYKAENLYRDYSQEVILSPQYHYIINTGSIGQPRDRNPRSCFCLFDTEKSSIKFIRVEYNIKKTQEEIENAGLPLILAARLSGGW